ncbi:hypothetical protein [Eleftheria terrae]|uniref:hypothetical protein n=1 Tax=Eleftheria terrae TaxID=1597781 RepID=UPI00263A8D33|nr:hypothetical protein [Eleftheria terrae]WKB53193.1 hypothetical protein N7L95_01965 [Eleftheria terrae]
MRCVPSIDVPELRAKCPFPATTDQVLGWLYDNLVDQGVMAYVEWKEFNAFLDDTILPLAPLRDAKVGAIDMGPLYERLADEGDGDVALELDHPPYVEHVNRILAASRLQLLEIGAYENAHLLCVCKDQSAIDRLCRALSALGIPVFEHAAA